MNEEIEEQKEQKALKTRSLRLSDETVERLKAMAKEISGNNEDVLVQLFQTFEMEQGKEILPDRSKEIADFESYIGMIRKMYIHSLEDYSNLEEKVLLKYEDKLQSKDITISDLQRKVTELQQIKENATQTAKQKTEESAFLQKEFQELQTSAEDKICRLENNLKDKEGLIEELRDGKHTANEQIAVLSKELSDAKKLLEEVDTLKQGKIAAENKLSDANKQITELEKQLERSEEEHKAAIEIEKEKVSVAQERYQNEAKNAIEKATMEKEKALLEQEKKFKIEKDALETAYKEQIADLEQKYKAEVEKYQNKCEQLLDKLEK